MLKWKKMTVGDLCDTISDTYHGDDEEVVLINTSDVLEGKVLNHQVVVNKNLKGQFKKTFKENDILYSEIRPANKRYAFVDFEDTENYIASTKLMVLRSREDVVRPRFLFSFLSSKSVLEELQQLAETRSGTFPQITFSSELAPIPINIPDLETQDRIVGILDAIERKISTNDEINKNLQAQAQAIYTKIFITDVNSSWPEVKLSDLIEVCYGKDHKKLSDGDIPVYGSGGIMRHVDQFLYDQESVLIPRKGTLNNVMYVNEPFWSVDTMFFTKMKKKNVAKFVFHFLKGKDLASMNAGSAVPSMTTKILDAISLHIPDEKTLSYFEALTSPYYETIASNDKESETLATVRDSLLPRLMSGEIDVSNIDL